MALSTISDFDGLKGSFLTYLQAKKDDAGTNFTTSPTKKLMLVSTYYNTDGSVLNHVNDSLDRAFYRFPGTGVDTLLKSNNSTLLRIAGTAYNESGQNNSGMLAIAFTVFNKFYEQKHQDFKAFRGTTWTVDRCLVDMRNCMTDQAYYNHKYGKLFKAFMDATISVRDANAFMKYAVLSAIRASVYYFHYHVSVSNPVYTGDTDFSNGGLGWDGNDFAIKGNTAYNDRYLTGFKMSVTGHDIWLPYTWADAHGSHANTDIPTTVSKRVSTKKHKVSVATCQGIFGTGTSGDQYWYQSAVAFGYTDPWSHFRGTMIYKCESVFEGHYNNAKIIGDGNASSGKNARGGMVNAYRSNKDPGVIA
jgi:hypothetical protein